MAFWAELAVGLAIGAGGIYGVRQSPLFACWWFGSWTVADVALAALNAALGSWGWSAVMAGLAAVNGLLWWQHWNRRRRKHAPRAYGAKSRALIATLVRKAREAAKPRRVLRPVPGGAS